MEKIFQKKFFPKLIQVFLVCLVVFLGGENVFAQPVLIWEATSNPSSSSDYPSGVAVDSTGVYVVGRDEIEGVSDSQWRIEKRNLNTGALIWEQTNNPSNGSDIAYGVAVDSTGMYIVGRDYNCEGTGFCSAWRMEKRNLDTGNLIWEKAHSVTPLVDIAYGVAVNSTGMYVVGLENFGGNQRWGMQKRELSTGALIWETISNLTSNFNWAVGVAVDNSGMYAVGMNHDEGDCQWKIEKWGSRYLNLSASPSSITSSTATDVVFTVTDSGSAISSVTVTLSGGATGSCSTNASGQCSIPITAVSDVTATASKTGYTNGTATVTIAASSSPTCTLTVSKTTIHEGDSVNLSWSSVGADTVVDSNFGATTVSGSDTLSPASTIIYELSISGTSGTGSCSSARVSVLKPPRARDLWIMDKLVKDIIKDAIDWAVNILAIIAILMMVVGGLAYTSSAGDLQRAEFAKKIIFWALGGLTIVGISYAVIVLVEKIAIK